MGRDIINLDDLTVNNLGVFKKINAVSLPTTYPEQWYKDSLNSDQIVKLAFYSELPVGAIKAKAINTANKPGSYESMQQLQLNSQIPNAAYIEVFAVLEAYRNLGIGSKLLSYLVEETKQKFIHEVLAHVHVDNKDALDWYLKKGFVKSDEVVKDYYKEQGLENPDAWVISLKF